MNGDITLEARCQWQSAAKVISPFIIIAVRSITCILTTAFFTFFEILLKVFYTALSAAPRGALNK